MACFDHQLLKRVRLDLEMSQEEAAHALQIDVRTYRRYESGAVNRGGDFDVRSVARQKLLRRMCAEFGVEDEQMWLVVGPPSPPPRARRGHTLLRAAHFVGREREVEIIKQFCARKAGLMVVIAVGGAGKTALVERAICELPDVFVHSFYDDPRTDAVLSEIIGESTSLVVLDGLESLQSVGGDGRAFGEIEDPALRRALRSVASGVLARSVLVTTRLALVDVAAWDSVSVLPLAPLPDECARGLLRAYGLRGDDGALSALCERSGGHALSVAMLGSYVGLFLGGDPSHALSLTPDLASADDPVARRLSSVLRAYAAALQEDERQLLARLSLFAGAADVALLSIVSGMEGSALAKTLARLGRYGLVSTSGAGVAAHPFVREHFKALLDVPAQHVHQVLSEALSVSLADRPTAAVDDAMLLERYEIWLEHTLAAGRPAAAWGIYQRALGGFENLGLRLGAMTRGQRVLARFGKTPDTIVSGLEGEHRAALLYDQGLYATALGDLPSALRCQEAHTLALTSLHSPIARPLLAMGNRAQAYTAWLGGDFDGAMRLLDASTRAVKGLDERFHQVRNHSLQAMVACDAGRADEALQWLALAQHLEPVPTARRALWAAEILWSGGRRDEALALVEPAIADCERRRWPGHVAHGETLRGLLALPTSPQLATSCLLRARVWVEASGEVEMTLRCHQLAMCIARAGGRSEEASREALLGRRLAAEHGFYRFSPIFTDPSVP